MVLQAPTVVLGAGGLLGRHIVEELGADADVIALDRRGCDLASAREVTARTAGARLIINCAAYTRVDDRATSGVMCLNATTGMVRWRQDVSEAAVDAQAGQHRAMLILFMGITVAMIWLVSVIFIWVFVYRPVRELKAGTKRVADGDLAHRLTVRSHDELSELAASFNKMTAEVAGARAEIEERVRRKTE